jgi:tagatose 1,6-diphosphate aldolase
MPAEGSLPAPPAKLGYERVHLRFVKIVPADPERALVPFYHFRILVDGWQDVGHINLRVGTNEHVRTCAGHVGYEVLKQFRGHGYALQACRALAPFARSVSPSLIITSDPDNTASIRTIEKLGAQFMDEVPVPPNDPHYERGSRIKRRYQWTP